MKTKDLLLKMEETPLVSVIIVNLNGEDYLEDCLSSLSALNYPQEKLEIIMVDNASTDDSVEQVQKNFPQVKLIKNKKNVGFAKAINQGAKVAKGDYLAFLNNDTKVDANWLVELLHPVLNDPEVVCAGSKILSWDGKTIDFVDSSLSWFGHGYKQNTGSREVEIYKDEKPLLFACGGAMLVDKKVYFEAGGLDDDYFAFFEDVDFGWRLWILGYKVVLAPNSVVYHRFHGTAQKFGYEKERRLLERNALASVIKNYEEENLKIILPAAILLTVKRGLVEENVIRKNYHFESPKKEDGRYEVISKLAMSHILALEETAQDMPRLLEKRAFIQDRRRRRDVSIFPLFKEPFWPTTLNPFYVKVQENLSKNFRVDELFQKKNQILIISDDFVGEKMAGPAIRSFEFARILSRTARVTLAIPNKTTLRHPDFEIKTYNYNGAPLKKLIEEADVIIAQGFITHKFPFIRESNKPTVIDVYDPFVLEILQLFKGHDLEERLAHYGHNLGALNDQLRVGDFFLCASEKQRDFWIGMLSSQHRINPLTYDQDSTLRDLIEVVPFGIPAAAPRHRKKVLKGVHPGIKENDLVILWGGGIYNWFDSLSLVKAMEKVTRTHPEVKLFFMGTVHPNPTIPEMRMERETVKLSESLELLNKNIFFNTSWVPYEERENYLLEADIGVSTHLEHLETEFSFRTRILDYIWAYLPIICTQGDAMSDLVKEQNLGLTCPPRMPEKLAEALRKLIENPKLRENCKQNLRKVAPQFTWDKVSEPLVKFCFDPKLAPDRFPKKETMLIGEVKEVPSEARPKLAEALLKFKFLSPVKSSFVASARLTYRLLKSPFYYLGRLSYYFRKKGVSGVIFHGKDFLRRAANRQL